MSRASSPQSLLSAVCGLICSTAFFAFFPLHIGAQPASPTTNSASFASLADWISLQEELLQNVDRTFIELDAALEANDYDADALNEFVRQKIAFEAYPGVVRGAAGTLQTRAGNALDQSLLLATLLRDAGYEARIVQTRIDSDLAASLLSQMTRVADPPQVYRDGASDVLFKIAEFLEGRNLEPNTADEDWEAELNERRQMIRRLSTSITTVLEADNIQLGHGGESSKVIEEIRDYYWCQYREGPSSNWVDSHPALDTVPDGFRNLEPDAFYNDEIPQELLQHISFQLFVSRRIGGTTEVTEISQLWTRPVANLYESPIVFSLVPSQFAQVAEEDYDASSDLFLPHLNESLAPGAMAFDLNGNVVSADAALSNMAGVFKTMSDKGITAATALQHLGNNDEESQKRAMALEDVWLEISLAGPGVEPNRRWKRSFRSNEGTSLPTGHSLARKVVISLAAGPLSPARSFEQSMRTHIEALKLTFNQQNSLKADALDGIFDQNNLEYDVDFTALEGIGDFTSYLDALVPKVDNGVSYRHQPLIVAKHYSLFPESEEAEGIDIINNSRRSFVFGDDAPPEFSPAVSLHLGVAEAVSEFAVLEWEYGNTINAVTAYKPVLAGAAPTVFSTSGNTPSPTMRNPQVRQQIENSLQEGLIVVTPPNQSQAESVQAWWEINPNTGETIGRTRNGWGGSYFALATSAEDIITRRIVIAVTCMMVVQSSCRLYSRTAVAAIAVAISGSGYAGCKAFFLFGAGSNLPPGTPDPCGEIKKGHTYVIRALRGVEDWLYKSCYERALPECVKAAAAGG